MGFDKVCKVHHNKSESFKTLSGSKLDQCFPNMFLEAHRQYTSSEIQFSSENQVRENSKMCKVDMQPGTGLGKAELDVYD